MGSINLWHLGLINQCFCFVVLWCGVGEGRRRRKRWCLFIPLARGASRQESSFNVL